MPPVWSEFLEGIIIVVQHIFSRQQSNDIFQNNYSASVDMVCWKNCKTS